MIKILNESILFSLRFLSQNSLWKLSTFHGNKAIYIGVCEECEKSVFIQIGHSCNLVSRVEQVASLSHELTTWLDHTFCLVVLQLLWPFNSLHASHMCHFDDLPVVSQLRDPVARLLWLHISWVFFTFSHTLPLYKSHLNIGYLISKLQANLARNKANTWLNKFNLTIYIYIYIYIYININITKKIKRPQTQHFLLSLSFYFYKCYVFFIFVSHIKKKRTSLFFTWRRVTNLNLNYYNKCFLYH